MENINYNNKLTIKTNNTRIEAGDFNWKSFKEQVDNFSPIDAFTQPLEGNTMENHGFDDFKTYGINMDDIFGEGMEFGAPKSICATVSPLSLMEGNFFDLDESTVNLGKKIGPVFGEKKKRAPKSVGEKKKKRVHSKPVPQVIDPSRKWFCSYLSQSHHKFANMKFTISSKSRLEKKIFLVPEKLYSSIRYQFFIELEGDFLKDQSFDFILVKLSILDSKTLQPIKDGLTGETEYAMNSIKKGKLSGKLRARFQRSLSSHNTAKEYVYDFSFFQPSELKKPVFSIRSPPFQIFSRKPNKKRKRKIEEDVSVIENPKKRAKTDNKDTLKMFQEKLDDLISFQNNLKVNEKIKCQKLLCDWLLDFSKLD